jgi:hypothetical protein
MQPDRNPAAQIRPTVKRCPDCGEPKPTSAFYVTPSSPSRSASTSSDRVIVW